MKYLIIIVAISAIAYCATGERFRCPNDEFRWYPHRQNCSRYYVCQDYRSYERSCAPGLLFDNLNGQCTFPNRTSCELSCPHFDDLTFLPNFEDCSKFFVCNEAKPVPRSCAEGLIFNTKYNWCDTSDDCLYRPRNGSIVETERGTAPTTTPTTTYSWGISTMTSEREGDGAIPSLPTDSTEPTTTSDPNTFKCPLVRGPLLFHHTIYCHKYFKCVNGVAFLRECPRGLLFDYYEAKCKEDAVCYDPSLTTTDLPL